MAREVWKFLMLIPTAASVKDLCRNDFFEAM
jgi:hypothetical protein